MIDWSILWQAPNGRTLLEALLLTFQIAAISWALSLISGIGIGLLREAPIAPLRVAGTVYVEIFRNIPLLVQLFFVYFIFPRILPNFAKQALFDLRLGGRGLHHHAVALQLGQDRRTRQVGLQHDRRRPAHGGGFQRPHLVAVPAPHLPQPVAAHHHAGPGIGISSRYSRALHRPWRSASPRPPM